MKSKSVQYGVLVITTLFCFSVVQAAVNVANNRGVISEQVCDQTGCKTTHTETGTQNVHLSDKSPVVDSAEAGQKTEPASTGDDAALSRICSLWQKHRDENNIRLNNWFTKPFFGVVSMIAEDSSMEAWNGIREELLKREILVVAQGAKVAAKDIIVKGDELCNGKNRN